MGCSFNNTNKSMLKYTQLCDSAYFLSFVGENSPMEKEGIKAGDLICEVDGKKIDNYGELKLNKNNSHFHIFDYLNYKKVGDKVNLKVIKMNDGEAHMEEKNIILEEAKYYKVREKYIGYENIDYQIIGGLVIMELTKNHFSTFKEKDNIKKFNRVDELIKPQTYYNKNY